MAADWATSGWTMASGTSEATAFTSGLLTYWSKDLPAPQDITTTAARMKTLLRSRLETNPAGSKIAKNGVLNLYRGPLCA